MTLTQRTIKITKPNDLPRKKKKALKKAMRVEWYEEPIDPTFLQIPLLND